MADDVEKGLSKDDREQQRAGAYHAANTAAGRPSGSEMEARRNAGRCVLCDRKITPNDAAADARRVVAALVDAGIATAVAERIAAGGRHAVCVDCLTRGTRRVAGVVRSDTTREQQQAADRAAAARVRAASTSTRKDMNPTDLTILQAEYAARMVAEPTFDTFLPLAGQFGPGEASFRYAVKDAVKDRVDAKTMSIDMVLSDERGPDRSREILVLDGLDTDGWKRNPLGLFQHNRMAPVGLFRDPAAQQFTVVRAGKQLRGRLFMVQKGPMAPFAEQVFQLAESGLLNGASIGFIADWKSYVRKNEDPNDPYSPQISHIMKSKAFEASLVFIPDNDRSLVTQVVRKGFGGKPLAPSLVQQLLPFADPELVWANGWSPGTVEVPSVGTKESPAAGEKGLGGRCVGCSGIVDASKPDEPGAAGNPARNYLCSKCFAMARKREGDPKLPAGGGSRAMNQLAGIYAMARKGLAAGQAADAWAAEIETATWGFVGDKGMSHDECAKAGKCTGCGCGLTDEDVAEETSRRAAQGVEGKPRIGYDAMKCKKCVGMGGGGEKKETPVSDVATKELRDRAALADAYEAAIGRGIGLPLAEYDGRPSLKALRALHDAAMCTAMNALSVLETVDGGPVEKAVSQFAHAQQEIAARCVAQYKEVSGDAATPDWAGVTVADLYDVKPGQTEDARLKAMADRAVDWAVRFKGFRKAHHKVIQAAADHLKAAGTADAATHAAALAGLLDSHKNFIPREDAEVEKALKDLAADYERLAAENKKVKAALGKARMGMY